MTKARRAAACAAAAWLSTPRYRASVQVSQQHSGFNAALFILVVPTEGVQGGVGRVRNPTDGRAARRGDPDLYLPREDERDRFLRF